jgi:phosphoserine phosphatase RsbU/P
VELHQFAAAIGSHRIEVVKALGTADQRTIATRRAGEFFGEMSLLEPEGHRTASVIVRSSLRLLRIARADFDVLLQQRPALAYQMIRVLSQRLGQSQDPGAVRPD